MPFAAADVVFSAFASFDAAADVLVSSSASFVAADVPFSAFASFDAAGGVLVSSSAYFVNPDVIFPAAIASFAATADVFFCTGCFRRCWRLCFQRDLPGMTG